MSSTRRQFITSAASALAIGGCVHIDHLREGTGVRHDGALGANYNEHFEDVSWPELAAANARWLRLFVTMPEVDGQGARHGGILALREANRRGLRPILTLKFPYHAEDFPRPGSARFQREIQRLDTVLPAVLGVVDILVIGNEPFIESRRQDQDEGLNSFYEALAAHVILRRAEAGETALTTKLYMGALNRLDDPEWRTGSARRWVDFAAATPQIEGVDIHPHVDALAKSKAFLDFVLPRLRPDQTFLATEFSLVHLWKRHLRDRIPEDYAARFGRPRETMVWQEIDQAIRAPFDEGRWNAFLDSARWFGDQKDYLERQMAMFRGTGRLAVATYGFRQGRSMFRNGFDAERLPWLLNSVYAAGTTKPQPDGLSGRTLAWFDAFRALQLA